LNLDLWRGTPNSIDDDERLKDMNATNWEELLSAYYDGELPPEERARVEAWLEEHPQGRQLLNQFSELSGLIGRSGEFTAAERGEVEQRQLQSRVLASLTPAPVRRWWLRSLNRWGIAVGALAATLLLVVALGPGRPNVDQVVNVGVSDPSRDLAPMAAPAMEPPSPIAITVREAAEAPPSPKSGPTMTKAMPAPTMAPASPFGPPAARSAERVSPAKGTSPAADLDMAGDRKDSLENRRGQLPILTPGMKVDPGEILYSLASDGGEAVLVEYTVVDVRKAAGEMEVLLRKHGIQSIPATGKNEPAKKVGEAAPFFAIYVEANDLKLAAALKDFAEEPTSVEVLEPSPPAEPDGSGRIQSKGTGDEEVGQKAEGASQVQGKELVGRGRAAGSAYQTQFPLSQKEVDQVAQRSVKQQVPQKPVSQRGYGDFVQQRRSGGAYQNQKALPGSEQEAARVLIVLQPSDGPKM
jgi:hypothetical protein